MAATDITRVERKRGIVAVFVALVINKFIPALQFCFWIGLDIAMDKMIGEIVTGNNAAEVLLAFSHTVTAVPVKLDIQYCSTTTGPTINRNALPFSKRCILSSFKSTTIFVVAQCTKITFLQRSPIVTYKRMILLSSP